MRKTMEHTGGLIYSQRLLLALIHKGAVRKEAYERVQRHAMAAWKGLGHFQQLVSDDPIISGTLSKKEIADCFDPRSYIRHQNQIFRRVFGRGQGSLSTRKGRGAARMRQSPKTKKVKR